MSIKHSLKKSLKAGVSFHDYNISHYTETVEIVALAALETLWVEVVESALNDSQPLNRIKDLYRLLTSKITVLCSEVIHGKIDSVDNEDAGEETGSRDTEGNQVDKHKCL